jgi:hypothetical protein
MYIYYEVAKVQAYATTTAIRLVVRLPLRRADRIMNLFRSVPLPVYSQALGRHVQIEPETLYLAVTENGQHYSLLTMADLQQSKLGSHHMCSNICIYTQNRSIMLFSLAFWSNKFRTSELSEIYSSWKF